MLINFTFLRNGDCCPERLTWYLVASWCDLTFILQICTYLCLCFHLCLWEHLDVSPSQSESGKLRITNCFGQSSWAQPGQHSRGATERGKERREMSEHSMPAAQGPQLAACHVLAWRYSSHARFQKIKYIPRLGLGLRTNNCLGYTTQLSNWSVLKLVQISIRPRTKE